MSKARCRNCGDVIESTHRHHMVACKCYLHSKDEIAKLDRDNSPEYWAKVEELNYGFALDGGDVYTKINGNFSHVEFLDADQD